MDYKWALIQGYLMYTVYYKQTLRFKLKIHILSIHEMDACFVIFLFSDSFEEMRGFGTHIHRCKNLELDLQTWQMRTGLMTIHSWRGDFMDIGSIYMATNNTTRVRTYYMC